MRTRTRHATYHINYPFVWCPKDRRPALEGTVANRLADLLSELARELEGEALGIVIRPDHVRLFATFSPKLAPAQIAFRLKGTMSRVLCEEYPFLKSRLPSLWTRSYYVGNAGHISSETIRKDIEAQKRQ
jgi:putative transposase